MQKTLLASLIATALTTPLQTVQAVEVSDQLEVFGTIEVEYGNNKIKAADGTSTTEKGSALATGAFGSIIKPNDKFDITTSFLYEEDLNAVATPLELDEAFVTWHAMPEEKLDITAGKKYLSFGKYDTSMVSDPLTLELGETNRKEVLQASTKNGNLSATGYLFNGEAEKTNGTGKHKSGFGLSVGYETEKLSGGIDYVSNITESGGFGDVNNASKKVPGVSIYGSTKLGNVTLMGEHLMATKAFQAGDLASADEDGDGAPDSVLDATAKPAATHLEAAFDLQNDRTIAIGWDKTKQAAQLGLDKTAYGVAYRQPLYKDLTGAIELRQSKGYDDAKTRALTAQVAYEF